MHKQSYEKMYFGRMIKPLFDQIRKRRKNVVLTRFAPCISVKIKIKDFKHLLTFFCIVPTNSISRDNSFDEG